MRPARLLVLAVIALATAALTTPAAFAQSLEVLGEEHAAGQEEVHHCPPVALDADHNVTGGCTIHFNNEGVGFAIVSHQNGTEPIFTVCSMEFTARVGEDGLGYIRGQTLGGANCGLTPCDEAAPSHATVPWPTGLFEFGPEPHSEEEVLVFTFCIRALNNPEGAQGLPCTLVIDANPQPNHAWELRANDAPCLEGNGVEISGHWISEGGGIETIHPDDIE
jgi:hypothetical protein